MRLLTRRIASEAQMERDLQEARSSAGVLRLDSIADSYIESIWRFAKRSLASRAANLHL